MSCNVFHIIDIVTVSFILSGLSTHIVDSMCKVRLELPRVFTRCPVSTHIQRLFWTSCLAALAPWHAQTYHIMTSFASQKIVALSGAGLDPEQQTMFSIARARARFGILLSKVINFSADHVCLGPLIPVLTGRSCFSSVILGYRFELEPFW